ncbi:MAG TPA: pyridoxal-phosphate dependent enzyme, partial [Candidatus Bathyarchaeia archaeon]|nr:pyridoxal-phosphate dependent enzyme [Candidatus Bathyarchaeia archaeon]
MNISNSAPCCSDERGLSGLEVGKTPLLRVDGIFAKLECTNPLGSIKDRMAKYIIEESEKQGLLRRGMTIVEASSG